MHAAKSVPRSSASKANINFAFNTKFESPLAREHPPLLKKEDATFNLFNSTKTRPRSFWDDLTNQKRFLQYLANELDITKVEDWYKVEFEEVKKLGGFHFIRKYGGSLPLAIASLYPNAGFEPWKFHKVPKGYWDNIENQRRFFDWLGKQLNIKSYNDWYEVSSKTITEYGGGGLIAKKHDNSVRKAIMSVFPEHDWVVWRFKARVPDGYWDHEENVSSFLKWCVDQFELKHPTDWLQITREQLTLAGGKSLLEKYGGILPMLTKYYPQIDWTNQMQKLRSAKLPSSKTQQLLIKSIRHLFPGMDIRTNYRHSELIFKNTNREMELDVFIPQLSLAFEYQGPQHYEWTTLYGSPEVQKQRDTEKKATCSKLGITLIEVPFWWDRSASSVVATVLKQRPDAAPYFASYKLRHSQPIPEEIPKRVKMMLRKNNANRVLLSEIKKWNNAVNPADCWACNRVEGVRVLWDGDSILRTQDEVINAPSTFLDSLPRMALDGVLNFGKGDILQWWPTLSKKTEEVDNLWNTGKLFIYDAPQIHLPFEERMRIIEEHIETPNEKAVLMKPRKIESSAQLESELQQSQQAGYAGLYIRKSQSMYIDQDSWFVLQKPEQEYAGVLKVEGNTLDCKMPNGTRFTVELSSDKNELRQAIQTQLDKQDTPVITIQHQGLENGLPLQPILKELRPDFRWDSLASKFFVTKTAYFLATGRKGTHPTCRGCKRTLNDKKELRISIKGAFTPLLQSVPVPVNLSVCANSQCIEKAAAYTGKNSGLFLPPFENIIAVPEKLKPRIEEAKQTIGNSVEWIVME